MVRALNDRDAAKSAKEKQAAEEARSRIESREREELGPFATDNEEGNYARGEYRWRNGGPKPAAQENEKSPHRTANGSGNASRETGEGRNRRG